MFTQQSSCWPYTAGKKFPTLIGRVWFSQIFKPQKNTVQFKQRHYSLYWDLLSCNFLQTSIFRCYFLGGFFFPSYFYLFSWAWEVEIFSYFSTSGELRSCVQSGLHDKIKPDPLSYSYFQRLQAFSTRDVRGCFSLLKAGSNQASWQALLCVPRGNERMLGLVHGSFFLLC